MKLKEKVLSAALAASMVVPMAMPVMAVDGTIDPTTATTNVTYEVTQGYEWNIHTDINFGTDTAQQQGGTVSVTKNVIPDGKKLEITVRGNGGGNQTEDLQDKSFKVANGSTKLNYTVTKGEESIAIEGKVLDVPAGKATDSTTLTFNLTTNSGEENESQVAGHYSGKLIYTASIVNQ